MSVLAYVHCVKLFNMPVIFICVYMYEYGVCDTAVCYLGLSMCIIMCGKMK